jgi:ferritin
LISRTEPEPEADTDTDSPDTNSTTKVTAASSSSETIDADNNKKPAKRRCLTEHQSTSGKDALLDLMKEENKCRAEYDNCITNLLDTFVKDSREQKAEFASLLRDLSPLNITTKEVLCVLKSI